MRVCLILNPQSAMLRIGAFGAKNEGQQFTAGKAMICSY